MSGRSRYRRWAVTIIGLGLTATASAQSSAARLAEGDRAFAAHRGAEAYAAYRAAVAADSTSFEALWKLSRSEVDLGEAEPDPARRSAYYVSARTHAQQAVHVRPNHAEGHFAAARAAGRAALAVSSRERIAYAKEVRSEALEALKYDPEHAGALHVLGVWHAEVMRLNPILRSIAKTFLGGQVFGTASWAEATRYMERAVAVDPTRIVHRLDLGMIYADRGMKTEARETFGWIARAPVTDANDALYKSQAAARLRKL